MNRVPLRIYRSPDDSAPQDASTSAPSRVSTEDGRKTVTLPLLDVLPLIADAHASRRTWLRDFEDDELTISTDLYEVLLAYQHYRRPSA